jgi:hypothetical protein
LSPIFSDKNTERTDCDLRAPRFFPSRCNTGDNKLLTIAASGRAGLESGVEEVITELRKAITQSFLAIKLCTSRALIFPSFFYPISPSSRNRARASTTRHRLDLRP